MSQLRLKKLYNAMNAAGLEAVALNPGQTLTYMTGVGFHLMERPIVILYALGRDPAIILPELEILKVELLPYRARPFAYGEYPADWADAFKKAVQFIGADGKKIGVEPRAMRLLEFRYLQAGAPRAEFSDASVALGSLRLCKEAEEVEKMRRAVKIAQDGLKATLPLIKIGIAEREIASELVVQLLRQGSDPDLPFAPIVSGGPNSANPHAFPSERKLQAGDMVVVDWGAAFRGYVSDLTRTFAIGEVAAEFQRIHKIVQEANSAGRAAGKPGVPCAAVDKAAREVIEKSGYGPYFTHRTGHGIGMEGHEEPYMRGDNMQILEVGMAYTVEPGIYLPGRNGVRIEDNVVVTAAGAESLSDMEREIRVLG